MRFYDDAFDPARSTLPDLDRPPALPPLHAHELVLGRWLREQPVAAAFTFLAGLIVIQAMLGGLSGGFALIYLGVCYFIASRALFDADQRGFAYVAEWSVGILALLVS